MQLTRIVKRVLGEINHFSGNFFAVDEQEVHCICAFTSEHPERAENVRGYKRRSGDLISVFSLVKQIQSNSATLPPIALDELSIQENGRW